jgi:adenylate cyclase
VNAPSLTSYRPAALLNRLFDRIAAKIFGLALFLLGLTIALSLILLREVHRSEADFAIITGFDLPLAAAADAINETGLRRRLAFARWFGALNRDPPNREIVAEAASNFEEFIPRQQEAFRRAGDLLDRYPPDPDRAPRLAEIRALLKQIESSFQSIIARQRQLIEMQRRGAHDEANRMVNVLNDQTLTIQSMRSELALKVRSLTEKTAAAARERQVRVQALTTAATVSFVLLGLLIAAWVTRRLTRPIRSLTQAVGDVRAGDLNVRLQSPSRDEIGALTDSFNYFVQELRAKEEIKRTFGKYIDPRVLERMLQAPGVDAGAGERRTMTVSFGDLVGFSHLSEQLSPALMVALLNRHFGLQAQAVQGNLGIVDKYIGDAIMAFWGAPFVDPQEQAVLACRAALGQVESLGVLRAEIPALTGLRMRNIDLDARVGIATGEVVVGNIGSESSRSYTVIGDPVNLASRLEGANRLYGTRILIDQDTAAAVRHAMDLREIDTIAVKGRSEPVTVFELIGETGAHPETSCEAARHYEAGLRLYRARDWRAASDAFRKVLDQTPDDEPARLMHNRCATLADQPPDASWDGVWRLTEK